MLLQLTLPRARATVPRTGKIIPPETVRQPLLEADLRFSGSLRSIQALGRSLALPLVLVYVVLIGLLAFGHRCGGSWTADTSRGDWPERPAVELNVPAYRQITSPLNNLPQKFCLLEAGHIDSADHSCALCALPTQEVAPPARALLVRNTACPPLPYAVVVLRPSAGTPLTATSRGPPLI